MRARGEKSEQCLTQIACPTLLRFMAHHPYHQTPLKFLWKIACLKDGSTVKTIS